MSERYLASAWCQREREWFEGEVRRRGISGGVVLVVRVQPTDHNAWPAGLKDEDGHVVIGFASAWLPQKIDWGFAQTPRGKEVKIKG